MFISHRPKQFTIDTKFANDQIWYGDKKTKKKQKYHCNSNSLDSFTE